MCRQCGTHVPAEASFCPECGHPVRGPSGDTTILKDTLIRGFTPPPPTWSPDAAWTGQLDPASPVAAWPPRTDPAPAARVPAPPAWVPPPDENRGTSTWLGPVAIAVAAVAVVAALVVGGLTLWPQLQAAIPWPGAPSPTAEVVPTSPTTSRAASPSRVPSAPANPTRAATPDPAAEAAVREQAAVQELRNRSAAASASVSKQGQWVAQLASKWVGITDSRQLAANGTHTFYAVDILAESNDLASRVTGVRVVLLDSTTYGKRFNHNGAPLWVTMALSGSFQSSDDVEAWCASQFPELGGSDLTNQCMANRLNP